MRRKKLYRRLVYEFPHQLFSPSSNTEPFRPWLDELRGAKPLILEIGTGIGDFLVSQASKYPELFFLGIEIKTDRIYKAYAKAEKQGLKNIAFLQTEARRLKEFDLPPLQTIYLLFSDPWPKKRHIIRRLTSELYLPLYEELLVPKGELVVKTDNLELFEYSITSVQERHWQILEQDRDFKTNPDEQTQYEKRFVAEKKPIYYLKARRPALRK